MNRRGRESERLERIGKKKQVRRKKGERSEG